MCRIFLVRISPLCSFMYWIFGLAGEGHSRTTSTVVCCRLGGFHWGCLAGSMQCSMRCLQSGVSCQIGRSLSGLPSLSQCWCDRTSDGVFVFRVMGAVQKAVFRLNEPTKLDAFLRELGRSHINYGAKLEYMDVSEPSFSPWHPF